MSYYSENIKFLRKRVNLTQAQLSEKIGINRPTLASYEEGRAEPRFEALKKLSTYFKVSLDELIMSRLNKENVQGSWSARDLQILPIVVDVDEKERISLVSQKASAGYLEGFQDPEFIQELPAFDLPFPDLSQGSFRAFQIEGESMLPIPNGSYIIARYEDDWKSIKDETPYIVVSAEEGISYKRISIDLRRETLHLKPDNKGFQPYDLSLYEVKELWKAIGFISFDLEKTTSSNPEIDELNNLFMQLKNEVDQLKNSNK